MTDLYAQGWEDSQVYQVPQRSEPEYLEGWKALRLSLMAPLVKDLRRSPMSTLTFTAAVKGGVNPSSRGRGKNAGQVVHAVPGVPCNGYWATPALCGAVPGKRGFGWLSGAVKVNCPKCVKKLEGDRNG